MPFQSATSDVREEAGNVLDVDFSDPEIQEEQAAAYDFLSGVIGEYDATHTKLAAIKKLEIILAASFVLRHFDLGKAKDKYEMFTTLLETLKIGLPGAAGDIDFRYAFTEYASWPAAFQENPDTDIRPYKSTNVFVPP